MQFGLWLPNFDTIGTRDTILAAARLAEDEGWHSVWVTDHVLMPAPETPSSPARPYGHLFEVITTLAYVAGMTQRIKLGTSALVLAQRNPIVVAKEIAALDVLSQGRVILGVAAGWNAQEFGFLGADFERRGKVLEEGVAVLRALWTQERPTFHGQFYDFADTVFSPKPAQARLPIWISGSTRAAVKRAARIGDGWHAAGVTPDAVKHALALIRPHLYGRPFTVSVRSSIDPSGGLPLATNTTDGFTRQRMPATLDATLRMVEAYQEAGVDHMLFVYRDVEPAAMFAHAKLLSRELLPRFAM